MSTAYSVRYFHFSLAVIAVLGLGRCSTPDWNPAEGDRLVGVDISPEAITVVGLHDPGSGLELMFLESRPLPEGAVHELGVVDQDVVSQLLSEIWAKANIHNKQISISVRSPEIKTVIGVFPRYGHKDFDSRVMAALEELPGYDPGSYVADVQPVSQAESRSENPLSVVVAVPQSLIASYTSAVSSSGLEALVADTAEGALAAAYELNYGSRSRQSVMLIDLGIVTSVQVSVEGRFAYAKDFLASPSRKTISYGEGVQAIRTALELWRSAHPGKPIDRVYISGRAPKLEQLAVTASEELGRQVAVFEPLKRIAAPDSVGPPSTERSALAAVAVGLALRFANEPPS